MKNKLFFTLASFMMASSINAQVVNGGFNGSTGIIEDVGVASPWMKGCSYNYAFSSSLNNPEVKQNNGDNYVELEGEYIAYQGNPYVKFESVAQDVGPLAAGRYTVTFDARSIPQTSGNPGILLNVKLKNFTGCSWDPTAPPNPEQLIETPSIPLVYNFNTYSVTFCIPDHLDGQLNILEFGTSQQHNTSISCDGIVDLDNISLTHTPYQFDISYAYKIDCLTGLVKVKPNSALDPNLYDMFILMENNPNDPNNQSDAGDIVHDEIAWWGYTIDAQGWYTFNTPLDPNKNYYIKRGIWGDCQNWSELRKFNVEMTADQFDPSFTFEINCNENLEPKLTVTGADQLGKNPHHMFILVEYFPGTNQQEQQIESFSWWQQSNASNYQYQQGPFTFNHTLDPNKHYYVKRGVWDACTPWQESRRYDIDPQVCDPNDICDIYITALQPPCFDGCGTGKWLSEFQINPNSTCYNAIDYVVFNTVNNHPFGPTFTDNTAPYTVPYCTSGNYYVTATVHYLNGTTSTASYYQPACFDDPYIRKSTGEQDITSEEITLYPNPATSTLTIETGQSFDELHVYSIGGKLIDTHQESTIDVSHLENGYYLVKLVKDGNVLSTKRFTKQ